jgi:adenylate kinase
MIATFFGSPGSGKGTQADLAAEAAGLSHVSTGGHFRREIHEDTALGREIREVIEGGNLVSDRLVNRVVFGLLDGLSGVLLDGYPRNVSQARSLDAFLEEQGRRLDLALFLDVPEAEAMERLAGRRQCTACGAPASHLDETCGACGAGLARRNDDDPAVIHRRFVEYRRQTRPLEKYYHDRLAMVDGLGTVKQVHQRVLKAMEPWL